MTALLTAIATNAWSWPVIVTGGAVGFWYVTGGRWLRA